MKCQWSELACHYRMYVRWLSNTKTQYLKRAFSPFWKFYIILLIFKIMLNTNNLYLFYELILNPQHFNNNWTASSNSPSGIPAKPKTILGGFSCSFSNE